MIISVNWLKKFTDIDVSIDELAILIGARLVEIEGVENIGEKYKDVIVARVVECEKLEGSDHLNVTKIDDGGVVQDIERDENGLVQVVCGAPNVRAGLLVAWLPPRSIVPETFHDSEPFVLAAKPLRGVVSNGMLASARELDLYDDHAGILELDKEAPAGSSFAELYELNDYLLDIENKSLTHRPDAFGVIGFAREIAGIQGKSFETPAWLSLLENEITPTASLEAPVVSIDDPSLSDRFQVIALTGVNEAAQSPLQLQTYLARSGMRPVNALVDVSNYLMLLTGQPSHAYDYDKVKAIAGGDFTVRVRTGRSGEPLVLLDGKEIQLSEADVVIAAGNTAIGLAGIMGGQSTLTDPSTKSVLLEVATFNLYRMRSSQMRHGVFSEAVTRFTKGIPAPLGAPVLSEAVRMLGEYSGAATASGVSEDYPVTFEPITVHISEAHINQTLGTQFAAGDIAELLENVGFAVQFDNLEASITVPYWRQDIHIPEDIIEEVGRLAGFDTINLTVPRRDFAAVTPTDFDSFRSRLRSLLVRAGANEVLTYSFVHGDLLKKAGVTPENSYRIVNSISPELQYYRQSLTPNLLNQVTPNSKAGYDTFALFECNKVHQKKSGLTDEGVPVEEDRLALVLTDSKQRGDAYYQAKNLLEYALDVLGISVSYMPLDSSTDDALLAPFEPKRGAQIVSVQTGDIIGVVGEYTRSVQKNFKLASYAAGFEIDLRALLTAASEVGVRYQPPSRYPGTERDICFQVATTVSYAQIEQAAQAALTAYPSLITTVSPLDIYQAEGALTKNITLRFGLTSYTGTITNDEVAGVIDSVIQQVLTVTDGKVI